MSKNYNSLSHALKRDSREVFMLCDLELRRVPEGSPFTKNFPISVKFDMYTVDRAR